MINNIDFGELSPIQPLWRTFANNINMKDYTHCKKIFLERLKAYIDERSVLSVGKIFGIPSTTLNGWIKNETMPSAEYLILLAQKMGCSIDYLVGLEED